MYFLLVVIILLLSYIAFFTPERRRDREIRRIQKLFNTRITHELFDIDDPMNKTNSDGFVLYNGNVLSRNLALISYELKKKELEDKVENEKNSLSKLDSEEGDYITLDGSPESGRRYIYRAIRCYKYLGLSKLASEHEINKAYEGKMKDTLPDDIATVNYSREFLLDSLKTTLTISKEAREDFHNFFRIYNIFLKGKTEQERIDFEDVDESLQLELLDLDVSVHPKKYKPS